MLILTTEQLCLAPWQAVGLKWNSHSQMLESQERVRVANQGGGGGDTGQDAIANQRPDNSQVRACFAPGLSCVSHWKNPGQERHRRMWGRAQLCRLWLTGLLTLGVGFLESVACVHEAGGCVMLALQLQVQLGSLAESIPSSWNRADRPSFNAAAVIAPRGTLGSQEHSQSPRQRPRPAHSSPMAA